MLRLNKLIGKSIFQSTNTTTFYSVKTKNILLDEEVLKAKGIHINATEDQAQANDLNNGGTANEYILNLSINELAALKTIQV